MLNVLLFLFSVIIILVVPGHMSAGLGLVSMLLVVLVLIAAIAGIIWSVFNLVKLILDFIRKK